MKLLLPILGLALVAPTLAQDRAPLSVLSLQGKCEALSVRDEDLSDICAAEIVQVLYTDGHVELFVPTDGPEGRFLVFGGPRSAGIEAGVVVQQVDGVIASPDTGGENSTNPAALGQCRHEDPFAGPARFTCKVRDEDGVEYEFAFRTDGKPPENILD